MSAPLPAPPPVPLGLWGQFRRHLPRYSLGLVLLGIYQSAQYWFDRRLQLAIDAATTGHGAVAIRIGVLLIGVAVGAFVVRVLSRLVVFNAGRIAEYELRRGLLDRLQLLGPSFYRHMSSGEIMSRSTNDLLQVRLLLGFAVLNLVNTLFAFVSAFAVTLSISWKLTLASLASLPLLVLATRTFARRMFSTTRDNQQAIGKLSERVQSSMAGVRLVRIFGLERRELEDFERANQDYLKKSLALARVRGAMFPIMQAITALGILVVVWYGSYLILRHELSPGGFMAFFRALTRLTWPLMALGFLIGMLQRGRASYERLREIFVAQPDIVDGPLPPPALVRGHLEVRDLTFAYQDRAVLDRVSLELLPGRSLAIVGRTGSGKSTLAVLLARLQPTPRGSVFLDDADVCDLPLSTVRSTVGYVQQSPFLFSTTVGRNVGYALDEPDSGPALLTIREAAKNAQILDEVLALPDGLDTIVGERGVQLSGGQKQRIALARGFVAEPKILVLDDPLSAVDVRTERAILASIDEQRERRSVILITHRVAAAARCDHIVVLDAGRVIEQGSHAELIARGGLYASFAEEQRIEHELDELEKADAEAVSA